MSHMQASPLQKRPTALVRYSLTEAEVLPVRGLSPTQPITCAGDSAEVLATCNGLDCIAGIGMLSQMHVFLWL